MRMVGLLLQFWNGEVLKKIGDPCEGFIRVNEDTKRFSRL